MKQIRNEIKEKLSVILNAKFSSIGRAGNLLWIGFGDDKLITNMKGNSRIVNEYSLHVSCAWRLTFCNKIFVANGDYYIPKEGLSDIDFIWDLPDHNRFDEKIKILRRVIETNPIHVVRVNVDDFGGLTIYFDPQYTLEIFPDNSLKDEYWRFFSNSAANEQLIVFDQP